MKRKFLITLLAIIATLTCAIGLTACGTSNNGTYYLLNYDGTLDTSSYIKLDGGNWEDDDGTKGTFKTDGNMIRLYITLFGENEVLAEGTVENRVLSIDVGGGMKEIYITKDHKHQFSEWKTVSEATCTSDGIKTRTCACSFIETERTDKIPHTPDETFLFDDENHWNTCTVCGNEFDKSAHTDHNDCSVCGYPFFKYTLSADGTSYTVNGILDKNATVANIPATFKGLPVTSIGDGAFRYNNSLSTITIPNSVTSIGYESFRDCPSLTNLIIPDSVTEIGGDAFRACTSLTNLTIGNGVDYISEHTFFECPSLKNLTLGCKVINSANVFDISSLEIIIVDGNNPNFKSVDNCILSIDGTELILGCKNSIIPDSVTSIGDSAFRYCSKLTSITIPDSVISIGNYAFYGCSSLTSITIPDSVISIGNYAFYGCSSLTSITIPDSVTSVGDYAFNGCSSLTSITIPNGVTYIDRCTFENCTSLESITIPDSVTSIGYQAFFGCTKLIQSENGVQYVNNWVIGCDTSLTAVTLRNGTKGIAQHAFNGSTSLTNITIPNSVAYINEMAFYGCSSLKNITIPNSVISIGNYAFNGCSSLTSIIIPNSVTYIGSGVFHGCTSFTSINFEGTTDEWKAIEKNNFWNSDNSNYMIYCTDGTITKNGTVTKN